MNDDKKREGQDEYLWSARGADPQLRALEELLAPVRATAPLRLRVRRAWLVALAAAVLVFFVAFAALSPHQVPLRFINLFSDEQVSEIGVRGGSRVELVIGASEDGSVQEQIASVLRERGARPVHQRDGLLVIELPDVDPSRAAELARMISAQGRFAMVLVESASDYLADLTTLANLSPTLLASGISVEPDQWVESASGRIHSDLFLQSTSRADLETVFAELAGKANTVPEGLELAYEKIESGERAGSWRSYLVRKTGGLGRDAIAQVGVMWDPVTGRPEVLLTLSDEGGRRFEELTAAHVGKKLAIVMDGEVISAPVIQDRITGGQVSITVGAADLEGATREAELLAATLRAEPFDVPVEMANVTGVTARVDAGTLALAKGLMALLVALAMFVSTWIVARKLGAPRYLALAVRQAGRKRSIAKWLLPSLLGALAAWWLSTVLLPGIEVSRKMDVGSFASFAALGIMPFVSGFVAAELLAMMIPSWRARRCLGGGARRDPIYNLGLFLSLAFLLAQAHILASFLTTLDGASGFDGLDFAGVDYRLVFLCLVGGSVLLYSLARWVTTRGLGNGFVWVYGGLFFFEAALRIAVYLPGFAAGSLYGSLVMVIGLVLATVFVLRLRRPMLDGRSYSLPLTGVAPILAGPAVRLLFAVSTGNLAAVQVSAGKWTPNLQDSLHLGVILGTAVVAAAWTLWPRGPRSNVRVVSGARSDLGNGRRIVLMAISVGYVSLFLLASERLLHLGGDTILPPMTVVLATAAFMDLLSELRARISNPSLTEVWRFHEVQRCDDLTEILIARDIEVHVGGRNLRALLRVLGPYVPMIVRVPEHRVAEVRELIATQLSAELGELSATPEPALSDTAQTAR